MNRYSLLISVGLSILMVPSTSLALLQGQVGAIDTLTKGIKSGRIKAADIYPEMKKLGLSLTPRDVIQNKDAKILNELAVKSLKGFTDANGNAIKNIADLLATNKPPVPAKAVAKPAAPTTPTKSGAKPAQGGAKAGQLTAQDTSEIEHVSGLIDKIYSDYLPDGPQTHVNLYASKLVKFRKDVDEIGRFLGKRLSNGTYIADYLDTTKKYAELRTALGQAERAQEREKKMPHRFEGEEEWKGTPFEPSTSEDPRIQKFIDSVAKLTNTYLPNNGDYKTTYTQQEFNDATWAVEECREKAGPLAQDPSTQTNERFLHMKNTLDTFEKNSLPEIRSRIKQAGTAPTGGKGAPTTTPTKTTTTAAAPKSMSKIDESINALYTKFINKQGLGLFTTTEFQKAVEDISYSIRSTTNPQYTMMEEYKTLLDASYQGIAKFENMYAAYKIMSDKDQAKNFKQSKQTADEDLENIKRRDINFYNALMAWPAFDLLKRKIDETLNKANEALGIKTTTQATPATAAPKGMSAQDQEVEDLYNRFLKGKVGHTELDTATKKWNQPSFYNSLSKSPSEKRLKLHRINVSYNDLVSAIQTFKATQNLGDKKILAAAQETLKNTSQKLGDIASGTEPKALRDALFEWVDWKELVTQALALITTTPATTTPATAAPAAGGGAGDIAAQEASIKLFAGDVDKLFIDHLTATQEPRTSYTVDQINKIDAELNALNLRAEAFAAKTPPSGSDAANRLSAASFLLNEFKINKFNVIKTRVAGAATAGGEANLPTQLHNAIQELGKNVKTMSAKELDAALEAIYVLGKPFGIKWTSQLSASDKTLWDSLNETKLPKKEKEETEKAKAAETNEAQSIIAEAAVKSFNDLTGTDYTIQDFIEHVVDVGLTLDRAIGQSKVKAGNKDSVFERLNKLSALAKISVKPIDEAILQEYQELLTKRNSDAFLKKLEEEVIAPDVLTMRNTIKEIQEGIGTRLETARGLKAAGKKVPLLTDTIAEFNKNIAEQQANWLLITDPKQRKDKEMIATLLAKANANLQELQLLTGDTSKLLKSFKSQEEADAFVKEKGFQSLLQDVATKKITEQTYKDILGLQMKLKTLATKTLTMKLPTSKDVDDMKEALEAADTNLKSYKTSFDEKNIKTITDYLAKNSPEIQKATKMGQGTVLAEKNTREAIETLNNEVNAAFANIKVDTVIIPDINFKVQFENIIKLLSGVYDNTAKTKLAGDTRILLAKFMDYVAKANEVWINASSTLWRLLLQDKAAGTNSDVQIFKQAKIFDAAEAQAKNLRTQYLPFVNEIEPSLADLLKKSQDMTVERINKILTATDKKQNTSIANGILATFEDKLANAALELTKNKFVAVSDFNEYSTAIGTILDASQGDERKNIELRWNTVLRYYAMHLSNALDQYSIANDLPNLHKVASESTATINQNVNKIIAEEPFNVIRQMLEDLKPYLVSSNNSSIKETIYKKVWTNFCFMLAAFDGFSYALFNTEVKADSKTGQVNADPRTGLWAWLWSWFRIELVDSSPDQFKAKYTKMVNTFMTKIEGAIRLYDTQLLRIIPGKNTRAFDDGTFKITTDGLGIPVAKQAGLLTSAGEYVYQANIKTPIILPGGKPVNVIIPTMTALHKKEFSYEKLVTLYAEIITGAYYDQDFVEKAKVDRQFKIMQDLARKYSAEMREINNKIATIEADFDDPKLSMHATLELRKQRDELIANWKKSFKNTQEEYERLQKALVEEPAPEAKKPAVTEAPKPATPDPEKEFSDLRAGVMNGTVPLADVNKKYPEWVVSYNTHKGSLTPQKLDVVKKGFTTLTKLNSLARNIKGTMEIYNKGLEDREAAQDFVNLTYPPIEKTFKELSDLDKELAESIEKLQEWKSIMKLNEDAKAMIAKK
jgi:hypothetical protein